MNKPLTVILMMMIVSAITAADDLVISSSAEHDSVFNKGADKISPYMILTDKSARNDEVKFKEITQGIVELNAVTKFNPKNWPAFWIKGKGYQALGDHKMALLEFKYAYAIQNKNVDVAREYAVECLEFGMGEEAIRVTTQALTVDANNAGLYANLALAYLIDGKLNEAKSSINQSLLLDPKDSISISLKGIIIKVINGDRKQPKNMKELDGG